MSWIGAHDSHVRDSICLARFVDQSWASCMREEVFSFRDGRSRHAWLARAHCGLNDKAMRRSQGEGRALGARVLRKLAGPCAGFNVSLSRVAFVVPFHFD